MSREIFKLQYPLVSSDPDPMILAYNEGKKALLHLPITNDLRALFGEDEEGFVDSYKIFVWAEYDDVVETLRIQGKAPFQEW